MAEITNQKKALENACGRAAADLAEVELAARCAALGLQPEPFDRSFGEAKYFADFADGRFGTVADEVGDHGLRDCGRICGRRVG